MQHPHNRWNMCTYNHLLGRYMYHHVDKGGWHIRPYLKSKQWIPKLTGLIRESAVESRLDETHNISVGIFVVVTLTDHNRELILLALVQSKDEFTRSAISNHQDCSKRSTLYPLSDLLNRTTYPLLWEASTTMQMMREDILFLYIFLRHIQLSLTSSAGSTLIPIETSASVTIYSVSACTSILTWETGTFVGIWRKKSNVESNFLDTYNIRVFSSASLEWVAYLGGDICRCYIVGSQQNNFLGHLNAGTITYSFIALHGFLKYIYFKGLY